MCGIVGYVGPGEGVDIVLEGLRRLEYRGYDSAGVAVLDGDSIKVRRCKGKLQALRDLLKQSPIQGNPAIGHTRWATHGVPSQDNAHPHQVGECVLVHNGIVENFLELREYLYAQGRRFSSQTDTELISHLVDMNLEHDDLLHAVAKALARVKGSFALAVLSTRAPGQIVVARRESPLVVGLAQGETFVASDIPAILGFSNHVVVMEDNEIGVVTRDGYEGFTLPGLTKKQKTVTVVNMTPAMAEKEGYKHFMLKEIFEQPQAISDTLRGRMDFDKGDVVLSESDEDAGLLQGVERVHLMACGTSLHAAMVGKILITKLAHVPVEVHTASDFDPDMVFAAPGDLFVAISQSGETIDTLKSLKAVQAKGGRTMGICNVVASSIARQVDTVMYTRAGPEVSVASTKAFTAQLAALFLLAVGLGRRRGALDLDGGRRMLNMLATVPGLVSRCLAGSDKIREIAHNYMKYKDFLYLGRGLMYPVALEGALKLKEISYVHAEGYSAGEMKHGPIALIDPAFPTVMVVPNGPWYRRTASNLEEVRARDGLVIAVVSEGNRDLGAMTDEVIEVPDVDPLLAPFVATIPLQLFAYHVADLRGTDVDQPRNLAKSVTVE